jgi:hypothetical protein
MHSFFDFVRVAEVILAASLHEPRYSAMGFKYWSKMGVNHQNRLTSVGASRSLASTIVVDSAIFQSQRPTYCPMESACST